MPPVHTIEVTVFAAALLVFSLIPSVLALAEDRRRRRAQLVTALESPDGHGVGAADAATTGANLTSGEAAVGAPADLVPEDLRPVSAAVREEPSVDGEAPLISSADPVLSPPPAAEVVPGNLSASVAEVVTEPVSAEEVDTGNAYTFRLDDLRRARALETPEREALQEQALQQAWEEGLQLADRHAAEIGRTSLSASFEPQARAFHEMRIHGANRELRFLLFPTLWPTALEQAAGEAVFDIGPTGLIVARVVRRVPA